MRDIQMVLERWGQWAQDNSGVDYSPIAAGFKGLLPDTRKSKPSCCDNDGLIIDGAVGRLKKVRDERELGVIMLHYCYGVSKSAIARRWKISEGSVRQKLMMAESFIEGCLAMAGATLEMDAWTSRSEISAVA
ncbi:antitermination protein [Serratia marcescens]|uniref:antiterminator Q family protein n=1 Tax=Serratia marcescens TaxID=615 RepID=UPI0013780B8B|nr:antiterminator Q family protein [Serratia marcescens]MBH3096955.1 antitermination protein [Serratia marcescens]MBH3218720.1 antitermination protein [Serratia marcescens]NCI82981.1 antitermination protein [Serratia marcescens]NDI92757.1 antitermination protein [Serratia marcescens]NDJ64761.1 antitermination protein [Serratia marcescens]